MTLEPLLETGVLANHSSDFSLTDSQPAGHTDLFMEVIPQHGQSGNHAMLTLMAIILVYSWLCCAHGCFYTCTVHLYTLTVKLPQNILEPSMNHSQEFLLTHLKYPWNILKRLWIFLWTSLFFVRFSYSHESWLCSHYFFLWFLLKLLNIFKCKFTH